MKLDQIQKSVGFHVQIEPPECLLDEYGLKLSDRRDDWRINVADGNGVKLFNIRSQHFVTLSVDQIYGFTHNRERNNGGTQYAFLSLRVQVLIQGITLWVRPTLRPGEPLAPPPVHIIDKFVDLRFPTEAGLTQAFNEKGYSIKWIVDSRVAEAEARGWEVVLIRDQYDNLIRYRQKGGQTLIKHVKCS